MKMLGLIVALGLLAAAPTPSFAQPQGATMDPTRRQGEASCGADVRKMCRKVMDQGDMIVLGCLQANAQKLSNNCRRFLQSQGQL